MTRFVIGYAKSEEARCKTCDNVIEKDFVRVGREGEQKDHPVVAWEHLHCLTPTYAGGMIAKHGAVANVPGIDSLTEEDRSALIPAIEQISKGTNVGEAVPKFLIGPRTAANYPNPAPKMKKKDAVEAREQQEQAAMGPVTPIKKGKRIAKHEQMEQEEEEDDEAVELEEGEALIMEMGEDGAMHKAKKTAYKPKDLPFEPVSSVV